MTAEQHTQLKELDGFGWRRKVTWVPDPGDTLQSSSKSVNYFLLNIFLWNDDGTKRFPLRPLVDTGAGDLFINLLQAEALGCNIKPYEGHELFAANDKPLDVRGQIRQSWYPEDGTQALWDNFIVAANLPADIIIGRERWDEVKRSLDPRVLASIRAKLPD